MGRAGGNYQQAKKGNKKRLDGTAEAKPVDGNSSRLSEQEAALKAAAKSTVKPTDNKE